MSAMSQAQRLHLFIDYTDKRTGRINVSLWSRVCEVNGWDKDDRQLRLDWFSGVLRRRIASSSQIGKLADFDELKRVAMAIIAPNNMNAQLQQVLQPLIRLRHRIRELADEPYILALVQGPRWKKQLLEDLSEKELEDLRNTLMDHAAEHRPGTLARRRERRKQLAGVPF